MKAYKVFTHDLRPPIQGGPIVWDGSLPHDLPVVEVDRGEDVCAAGWNACADPAMAIRIAGLWRDGWPARLYAVEAPDDTVLVRGDKLRAPTWRVVEEVPMEVAIRGQSAAFGDLAEEMVVEQLAWYEALGRPRRDAGVVERGLRITLEARGLEWEMRRYGAAWDAREARVAWAALTVYYASRRGWVTHAPDLLTVGIRDAYAHGLAVAVPTGPETLGWAMVEEYLAKRRLRGEK